MGIQPIANAPGTSEYAHLVGKLVANFGAIEAMSYMWIAALDKNGVLAEVCAAWQLRERTELIAKLVDKHIPESTSRDRAAALWTAVGKLSELRNVVCHSPVLLAWKAGPSNTAPDTLITAQLRSIMRSKAPRTVDLDELKNAVDESARLAQALFDEKAKLQALPSSA